MVPTQEDIHALTDSIGFSISSAPKLLSDEEEISLWEIRNAEGAEAVLKIFPTKGEELERELETLTSLAVSRRIPEVLDSGTYNEWSYLLLEHKLDELTISLLSKHPDDLIREQFAKLTNKTAKSTELVHSSSPTWVWKVAGEDGKDYSFRVYDVQDPTLIKSLRDHGVPAPKPVAHSIPLDCAEWIEGQSMPEYLSDHPEKLQALAYEFGRWQGRIHQIPVHEIPCTKDDTWMTSRQDPGVTKMIQDISASEPRVVCHFDYHPGNVLVKEDSITGILDWGGCRSATAMADLSLTQTWLQLGANPDLVLDDAQRNQIEEAWRNGYAEIAQAFSVPPAYRLWAANWLIGNALKRKAWMILSGINNAHSELLSHTLARLIHRAREARAETGIAAPPPPKVKPSGSIALILGAGSSSRFGTPKALLTIDGLPLVQRLINTYKSVCKEVYVVLGHDAEKIKPVAEAAGAHTIFNPHHKAGVMTSLQVGVQGVLANHPDHEGLLVSPVDLPLADPSIPSRLIEEGTRGGRIVVPSFLELHGYPIWMSRYVVTTYLGQAASTPFASLVQHILNSIVINGAIKLKLTRQNRPWIRAVPVENIDVVSNFNAPETYDSWKAHRAILDEHGIDAIVSG